jgi:uncharacterized SAM-binding protein YcdF (DUF218 family)
MQAPIKWLIALLIAVVGAPAALVGALLLDFQARSDPFSGSAILPRTAVVFSGSHDRLLLAMELLERGLVDDVFISGANGPGGIREKSFADDYDVPAIAREKLAAGHVIFAPQANNTLENAVETSCWLSKHPEIASVTLITSRWHMPRASLSLERALGGNVKIVRLPSEPQAAKYRGRDMWREELQKFLGTWFGSLVPLGPWGDAQDLCSEN